MQGETSYEAFNNDESRFALGSRAWGDRALTPRAPSVPTRGLITGASRSARASTAGRIRPGKGSSQPANVPPAPTRESTNGGVGSRQFFKREVHYYDTSKGCPTGTYSWVDDWGNKTCTAF